MKKPIPILVGLVFALAVGALVVSLVSARPRVSMTLVEYKRWPHGAMLRLTNGTQTTIRYLAERNGTPAGSPILCVQKTSNGWTTVSVAVRTAGTFQDPITGKSMEAFYLLNLAAPPKPGDPLESLVTRDLKPDQTVEFFVRIEPGAAPKRVGTICCVPQSKLTLASTHAEIWC
jgi:hypothetical protein